MIAFIKRLFCKHYKVTFVRNIYGGEIIEHQLAEAKQALKDMSEKKDAIIAKMKVPRKDGYIYTHDTYVEMEREIFSTSSVLKQPVQRTESNQDQGISELFQLQQPARSGNEDQNTERTS